MKRIAFLAPLILGGCLAVAALAVGAAAAVGTYAYIEGEGRQDYSATVSQTYQAALCVCEKSRLTIQSCNEDAFAGYVDARTSDNTSVKFRIDKIDDSPRTRVGIRVGTFGDESKTFQLHEMLGKELDTRGRAPQGP